LRAVRPHLDNTQWEPFAFEWKHGITLVVLPIGDPDWAICLAKHPITNSQYAIFVKQDSWGGEPEGESLVDGKWQAGFRPWRHSDFSGADKPVVCVSYNEAVMFTTWLEWYSGSAPRDSSVRIGDCDARIFIPSAQLWEFAAYGAWSRPSDIAPRIAELQAVHHRTNAPANTGGQTERANHLGLVDMFGNVWEWCADVGRYRAPLFQSGLYDADAIPDLRGGGFKDDVFQTDIFISAAILEAPAETKHFDIGFRVGAAVPLAGVPDRVRASLAECDQRTENIALGVGLRVSPLGPR
jgi:formylglycine-generating enzyme required for sulfatase activity